MKPLWYEYTKFLLKILLPWIIVLGAIKYALSETQTRPAMIMVPAHEGREPQTWEGVCEESRVFEGMLECRCKELEK